MTQRQQLSVSPRDVFSALCRQKKKAALFFFSTMFAVCVALVIWPRTYLSEAKMFVRVGRESVTLDPTATTGETVLPLHRSQESEINSIVDILESRRIAEGVVDILGVEMILEGFEASEQAGAAEGLSAGFYRNVLQPRIDAMRGGLEDGMDWLTANIRIRPPSVITDRERAVEKVLEKIVVTAPKESMVVRLTSKANSPQLAQKMLATMTDVFLDEHVRMHQIAGSFDFFSEQSRHLQQLLLEAGRALRDRKNEFGILTIEGKRTELEALTSDVELETLQAERSLASSQAKVADLERQLAKLSPELVTQNVAGFSNEARDGMRQQLYDLEIKERELLSKYAATHYLVIAVQKQRMAVEEILESEVPHRTQTTTGINPNYQTLQLELQMELANLQALQSRKEALGRQYARVRSSLEQLNDRELEIAQLERKVQSLDSNFRANLNKLEQSRIEEALGAERISNVNVIQPASLVGMPASPNKRLALALGLIVAAMGATTLALAAESLDQTFRTAEEAEAELALPVLTTLPRIASHRVILHVNGQEKCFDKRKVQQPESASGVLQGEAVH